MTGARELRNDSAVYNQRSCITVARINVSAMHS